MQTGQLRIQPCGSVSIKECGKIRTRGQSEDKEGKLVSVEVTSRVTSTRYTLSLLLEESRGSENLMSHSESQMTQEHHLTLREKASAYESRKIRSRELRSRNRWCQHTGDPRINTARQDRPWSSCMLACSLRIPPGQRFPQVGNQNQREMSKNRQAV